MKIEIEVVSTEIISPSSSQTPNDDVSNNYKLSSLDQMIPPVLMPYLLFYEATTSGTLNNSEISNRLKKSLSKTLSIYYPLSGWVVDNSYVDYNNNNGGGGGITYVEARANCDVLDVVNEPIPYELDKLLPQNVVDVGLITQATFFNCGGMAIGFAISHKLCDAWSRSLFVNNWAAISRGDDAHIRSPIFEGAKIFPPKSYLGGSESKSLIMNKEAIITKRFIFTSKKINTLRDIYSNTTRATRIEALTAFIWTRFMFSTQTKDDLTKIFPLNLPVNFRKRVVPPLSDDLFGNFFELAVVTVPSPLLVDGEEEGTYGYGVVEKLREAIGSIQGRDSHALNSLRLLSGEVVVPFFFTSHCRFPLYEADFGWGKPVWIGSGSGHLKNVVTFTDDSSAGGGGVEAWVTLNLEDMSKFEVDEEFLAYASTSLPCKIH